MNYIAEYEKNLATAQQLLAEGFGTKKAQADARQAASRMANHAYTTRLLERMK